MVALLAAPAAWADAQSVGTSPPAAPDGISKVEPGHAALDFTARQACKSSVIVTRDQVVVVAPRECASVVVADGDVVVTAHGAASAGALAASTAGQAPVARMSAP